MMLNEREVIDYLQIPSIPTKKWDGAKSFARGVALLTLIDGSKSYAVASFDSENDTKPRIVKVFSLMPYNANFEIVGIVPDYMDTDNINEWDLSKESIEAAQKIANEANELESNASPSIEAPEHEYFFDFINNDEEAQAYIRAWNKNNGIRGRVSQSHDAIIAKLAAIWAQENKQ